MRVTVGFTEDAPQHELHGRAGELLTEHYLAGAEAIGATRSLVMRADFLDAIDADPEPSPAPDLAEFIDEIRGEENELMVQLKWWPGS